MDTITGTWKGALIAEDGRCIQFALSHPSHSVVGAVPALSIDGARASARLLDGASRSFVALADDNRDPQSGRLALLLDARVLGDRLVGRWLRRNSSGDVVAQGFLVGTRQIRLSA